MKMDADEKELLESVERGEWKSANRRQARAGSLRSLRQGHVPEGSPAEHPAVEQGSGGNPEAGARGRVAVSDIDSSLLHRVRGRPAQGGVVPVNRATDHGVAFADPARPPAVHGRGRRAVGAAGAHARERLRSRLGSRIVRARRCRGRDRASSRLELLARLQRAVGHSHLHASRSSRLTTRSSLRPRSTSSKHSPRPRRR